MTARDPTARFSDRVADYVRWRPGYPAGVIEALRRHAKLAAGMPVADLGSGTGIFTGLLLETGARVNAVEPNDGMRAAAEAAFAGISAFTSVAGRSEATGLADASVDLVCAAQAFHWFDQAATRRECIRILRPRGQVALVWNERLVDVSPFLVGYEKLLKTYATDYAQVDHRRVDTPALSEFFAPATALSLEFPNRQVFDAAGVRGRLLSSSYAPQAGDPRHLPMLAELDRLFNAHQHDGTVEFLYTTRLHLGPLPAR